MTWGATGVNFLVFACLLYILCLHIIRMRDSAGCIRRWSWTGTWSVSAHLHKMNILGRLTGAADTSFRGITLFKAFVLSTLIRISINIHTLRLNLVNLIALACATGFHRLLINIPWRIMHQTTIIWINRWRGSCHYLLRLLYLQLHLLNLIHMLYLSFT